jgi:hypothetical protein
MEKLVLIARYLPERERALVLHEAVRKMARIRTDAFCERALRSIVPELDKTLLKKLVAVLRSTSLTSVVWGRGIRGIQELATRCAELGLAREALTVVQKFNLIGLEQVAPLLPEKELRRAMRLIPRSSVRERFRDLADPRAEADEVEKQLWVMADFAPRLVAFGHVDEAMRRVYTLIVRALYLGAEDRAWRSLLESMAPALPESELRILHAFASTINDAASRTLAIAAFAPYLTEPKWSSAYIPWLLQGLTEADRTSIIEQIAVNHDSAWLIEYIPYLSEKLLRAVLPAVRESQDGTNVEKIAVRFSELGQIDDALEVARTLPDDSRAETLMKISLTPAAGAETRVDLWSEFLPILSRRMRQSLLRNAGEIGEITAILGGEQAVLETVRSIEKVGDWWP